MSSSNDQWEQYFYRQSMDGGDVASSSIAFSDYSMITTTTTTVTTPSNSSATTSDHHLSPKGCGLKPVRRRSRASKKTPATLLNANTANFRALVQQFTGCPITPFSLGSSNKGPVNLSFALGSNDHQQAASVNNNHFSQQQYQPQKHFQQLEQHHHHHQQVYQDHQSLVPFDHQSLVPRPGNYLEIPNGFDMDEISMPEITAGSAFCSEDMNNSYF